MDRNLVTSRGFSATAWLLFVLEDRISLITSP